MTWTQTASRVTLSCNGRHDVVPQLATAIREGESALEATQRIWHAANLSGWTATSTAHACLSCARLASPNPTAP